jgi:uncharacterized protein YkwD
MVTAAFFLVSGKVTYGAELDDQMVDSMMWLYLPYIDSENPPVPEPTATPTATPTSEPPIPAESPAPLPTLEPTPDNWLGHVNYYRSMAELPPVTENEAWSHSDWLHARYMIKNDHFDHYEDPDRAWYTEEGLEAAKSSDLACHYDVNTDDLWAIDAWMQGPFHAIGIVDPALHVVGFGSYREEVGNLQMGAALDVIRGIGDIPPSVEYPVKWPSDGMIVPITEHWGEWPDPLTSCPGYIAPSGLPIILQIGPGNLIPSVSGHSFKQDGAGLDHCVFDETDYANPDSGLQKLGRNILDTRDAIILIPRDPLIPGTSYTASITANGLVHTWSFTVSDKVGAISVFEGEPVAFGYSRMIYD